MTHPIIIPNLGESITEVVLGEWLIQDGNWVHRDQPLLEIESDKVTQELPSPVSGLVTILNKQVKSAELATRSVRLMILLLNQKQHKQKK